MQNGRLAGRAGLALGGQDRGGDGIGYVGRLLRQALEDLCDDLPEVLFLDPQLQGSVSQAERARFAWKLLRAEMTGSADWWIFNQVGIARAQRLMPRRFRQPYAVILHGIEVWTPKLSADRLSTLVDATARISVSHNTARRVKMAHPQIGTVHPCPLGLLDEQFLTGRPDEELLSRIRPESVLIVGRMSRSERYKGHDELIDCWSRVALAIPKAQLVMVGGGDDAARLAEKAGALGMRDHVLFPGFIDDVTLAELWKRVAVFAMPSFGEGFGLVYLQAMRASLPCIGLSEGVAGEIIAGNETGFLVDRTAPDDLAGTIVRLLADSETRRRMGAAGRKRFEAEFTYGRFLARLRPILRSAFGS